MRQTCIGAVGSRISTRLPDCRARVWIVVFCSSLFCINAQPTMAAQPLVTAGAFRLDPGFVSRDTSFPPGPSNAPMPNGRLDSAALLPAAPNLYSETYWTAFADLDLTTLSRSAQSFSESQFAGAMTLLANGDHESAESAFAAIGQESKDLNIAVASQVMLAMTLRYQRKWAELRDVPIDSRLRADDRKLTSDLERWGKAFVHAEQQVVTFPDKSVLLPLKVTAVGTPTIRVKINGKEYDFWLDTGSSMTVVSSSVARDTRIQIISADTLTMRTFAGSVGVHAASVKSIEIGSIVFTNAPVVVIDESSMQLRASTPDAPTRRLNVDGIIGWDTIRHLDLVMDYAAGKILVRQPRVPEFVNDATRNLTWLGKPLVEVRTDDGRMLHFTIDTGAQSSFLNATVLEKTSIGTRMSDNRVHGIARTGRETKRVVPSLKVDVGGKSLRLQDVIVYGPVVSGLINCDGILGSDIARFGAIHIDATNGVFTIGASGGSEDAAE